MGMEPDLQIGKRSNSRLRVAIAGHLILITGEWNVGIADLSQSGAKFRTLSPVKVGEEGVLQWLHFETFGKIVWARGDYAGMEFDELLDKRVLLETRARGDSGQTRTAEQVAEEQARNWYFNYRNQK